MDSKGNIHLIQLMAGDSNEAEALKLLEEKVGPVITIPPDELQRLRAATQDMRQRWYMQQLLHAKADSEDEQRRQRNAAKRARRARR